MVEFCSVNALEPQTRPQWHSMGELLLSPLMTMIARKEGVGSICHFYSNWEVALVYKLVN